MPFPEMSYSKCKKTNATFLRVGGSNFFPQKNISLGNFSSGNQQLYFSLWLDVIHHKEDSRGDSKRMKNISL